MVILSQRDPRWASETLGKTNFTIGRWGCTITSISMYLSWLNKWKTPGELAKLFLFTKDGLLIWASLPKAGIKLVRRFYAYDKALIDGGLKHKSAGVLLQVENYHWVLAVGKTWTGDYKIADPWTGTVIALKSRYRYISGGAIIDVV